MNKVFCLLLLVIACAPAQELAPSMPAEPVSSAIPAVAPEPKVQPKAQIEVKQIPEQRTEPISEEDDKCYALGCPFGSMFVGDMKNDLYYACHCTFSKWIKPDDLLCFDSEAEAAERGYRPAQSC